MEKGYHEPVFISNELTLQAANGVSADTFCGNLKGPAHRRLGAVS
jgi:hypothetical protein